MTWILLRGLTREARHWGTFTQVFKQHLEAAGHADQDVLALDLPGNGVHAQIASPASIAQTAVFARQQLAQAGLVPPYSLMALSLGGVVATHWAQTWPQEVDRLVLISTSMRPHGGITQRLRPRSWPALMRLAAEWRRPEEAEAIVYRLTCNAPPGLVDTRTADIAEWARIRRQSPVRPADAVRQLLAAARFRSGPAPPRCPTLLLSSVADQLVNDQCSVRLARAWPDAQHDRHSWAGHDVPHDDPEWVCSRVLRWMDRKKGL